MPLFEFVCAICDNPFEELVRSAGTVQDVTCPACGSHDVKKKLSTFASKVSGGNPLSWGASSASACSTGST